MLAERCVPIDTFDEALQEFAESMVETMYSAGGIGLAANQVGDTRRILVIDTSAGQDPGQLIVACNPEILTEEGAHTDEEGCLSIPGIVAAVRRPEQIRVRYLDAQGEERTCDAEGLLARAWCHEVDHLDGRTIFDRISSLKRSLLKKKFQKNMEEREGMQVR